MIPLVRSQGQVAITPILEQKPRLNPYAPIDVLSVGATLGGWCEALHDAGGAEVQLIAWRPAARLPAMRVGAIRLFVFGTAPARERGVAQDRRPRSRSRLVRCLNPGISRCALPRSAGRFLLVALCTGC
jgi:hypothetical protein